MNSLYAGTFEGSCWHRSCVGCLRIQALEPLSAWVRSGDGHPERDPNSDVHPYWLTTFAFAEPLS
jgi:hypothetical protein